MTDAARTSPPAEPVDPALLRARRLRLRTILAIGAIAGVVLIATTQTWWTVELARENLTIAGTVAAPALSALALCGLALAAALAIAGPVFRFILGVLQLLLGFTITLTSIMSVAAPDGPSEPAVSKATGIAGSASIRELILATHETPWGIVAIVFGVLTFLAGVFLLATFRAWPAASRKYSAVRFENAENEDDPATPRDAVVDWDALSEGEDPTATRGESPNPPRA